MFNSNWNDASGAVQDVTDILIEHISHAYNENAPEFLYFVILYNLFKDYLENVSEDDLPNEAYGFKSSKIWNLLFQFQKDAVLGIIQKLEQYNGCILADSVGLGKTYTALAVIKYYQQRNKSILVLCPKKLAENWNTYRDNYKNAYPILKKYDFKATIFVISSFLGVYPNYLTWANVAEMQESGLIDFESHTLSHEELTKAPDLDEAKHQLVGSKQAIEWNLGKQVNFIAYPCGEYNDDIEQATKDAGYRAAFTVNYGLAEPGEDPFILDRVPIFGSNSHTLARFKLRLTLAPLFAPLNKVKMELREDHPTLASFILVP